jgi:hypothetical protein
VKRVNAPLSAPRSDRVRWQPLGLGAASAGVPVGIGLQHPSVGVALMIVELASALTIIATALFGTYELSERAFRLLRWVGNRPEPASPQKTRRPRQPSHASLGMKHEPGSNEEARGLGTRPASSEMNDRLRPAAKPRPDRPRLR